MSDQRTKKHGQTWTNDIRCVDPKTILSILIKRNNYINYVYLIIMPSQEVLQITLKNSLMMREFLKIQNKLENTWVPHFVHVKIS